MRVAVVIPARDEAGAIGLVVSRMPASLAATVIVVDNGSRDQTAALAQAAGAIVVSEPRAGYGHACRAGVAAAHDSDVVVFLDADGSMAPEEIEALVRPIADGTADLVCGVRQVSRATMPWHQRIGNRVIAVLLRVLWGLRLGELGPFRAVRTSSLLAMHLPGSRFAWPAQMLARAARQQLRVVEVPVGYAQRIAGKSKVGGSLRGSVRATYDIISVLFVERLRR